MKKLLATLIVAAMLISCMSIVAFANEATFATVTSYPYPGMDADNGKTGSRFALLDTGFAYLYDQYEGNGAVKYYDENGNLTGYVPSAGDYVAIPLNITANSGIGLVKAQIAFDSDIFEFVTVVSAWDGAFAAETLSAGKVAGGGMLGADTTETDVTALSFILKVKTDAVGDASGDAASTITFSNAKVVFTGASSEESGTIATPSLTMNLTGLTPGSSTKPEKVTKDGEVKVSDAVVKSDAEFTADAGDKTFLAGKANVVSGDGEEVDLYDVDGTYKAVFATNDFSGVQLPPEKFGLALYCNGTLKGLYEAKSVVEGKWGILFFNLDSAKTYTTKKYVQYDGEEAIVED